MTYLRATRSLSAAVFVLPIIATLWISTSASGDVFVMDNFANNDVTDSDSYDGYWTVDASPGALVSEAAHWLTFRLPTKHRDRAVASIVTAPREDLSFLQQPGGLRFVVRGIFSEGSARKSTHTFVFDVTDNGRSADAARSAVRVQVRADGELQLLVKRVAGKLTPILTRKLPSSVPAFVLELTPTRYTLRTYRRLDDADVTDNRSCVAMTYNTGAHGLTKATWGTGNGEAAIRIGAVKEAGAEGSADYRVSSFYVCQGGLNVEARVPGPPPGVSPDDAFYKMGMLNVGNAPYNARGDGITDDWRSLQTAIIDAYEYGLACYIPRGTYLISDTLRCIQKFRLFTDFTRDLRRGNPAVGLVGRAYVIIGESNGPRPEIRLSPDAAGFDGELLKPAIIVFSQARGDSVSRTIFSDDPRYGQQNINFNNMIRGVNIHLGAHPKAVGLDFVGAQGNTVEDVKVIASAGGGYAGFRHLIGHGGGLFNIAVDGCDYGILVDDDQRGQFPQIVGLTLRNQRSLAIRYKSKCPLTVVGFRIIKPVGPAIRTQQTYHAAAGHISLVDGSIQFQQQHAGTAIDNAAEKIVYLNDVYVKNADYVTGKHAANGNGWTQVREYCFSSAGKGQSRAAYSIVDGVRTGPAAHEPVCKIHTATKSPPYDLESRHIWDSASFPSFDDPQCINVKTDLKALGATSNAGTADDRDALQWAIDYGAKHDRPLFLPAGRYPLSGPLQLRPNTVIIGLGKQHTVLYPLTSSWATSHYGQPVFRTPDDPDARIVLAFLRVEIRPECANYLSEWRAGRNSIVRNIQLTPSSGTGPSDPNIQALRIVGNGGGRWYGCRVRIGKTMDDHPNSRKILIDGTHEPLRIYMTCGEGQKSEPMFEVRDARNVSVFGMKSEGSNTLVKVVNSSDVLFVGYCGLSMPGHGQNFQVVQSTNIVFAVLAPFHDRKPRRPGNTFTELFTAPDGQTRETSIPYPSILSYFRRRGNE